VGYHPYVGFGRDDVAGLLHAAGSSVAELLEKVRGRGLGRIRMDLGHRPCRLAHRTPVRVAQYDFSYFGRGMGNTQQLPECLPYYLSHCFLVLWVSWGFQVLQY